MKKLLIFPLLLATQILSMQPESKPEENDWRVTFIPTVGRRIPLHLVRYDKNGKQLIPIDHEEVAKHLTDKTHLQELFAKYSIDDCSLENPSEAVALIFARGKDGYQLIEADGYSCAVERTGFCHLDEGTIDRDTYVALKEECHELDLLSPFEITKEVINDAQRFYFSLYPEENVIKFTPAFCTKVQTTIRELINANVEHEEADDGSITFFLDQEKSADQ